MLHNDLTHTDLLQTLKSLGYPYKGDGICQGFAMMAVQAFLSDGNFEKFDRRIQFIKEHPLLADEVAPILHKIENNNPLTAQEQQLHTQYLDVRAFFDNLILYQDPRKFSDMFGQYLMQAQIATISSVAQSDQVEMQNGLVQIPTGGPFTVKSLAAYLGSLRSILNAENQNITLSLGPVDHGISVCYEASKKTWTVIDANNFDDTGIFRVSHVDASKTEPPSSVDDFMARLICQHALVMSMTDIFRFNGANAPFLLNINAIATGTNAAELQNIFGQFANTDAYKAINNISHEKVQYKYVYNGKSEGLLEWAIKNNTANFVEQIATLGFDLQEEIATGFTPLKLAAYSNASDVIDVLARFNIDLNQPFDGDIGVAHVAALRGNIEMLRVIDKHHGNLNIKDADNKTPEDYAKSSGFTNAIAFIQSVQLRDKYLHKLQALEQKLTRGDHNNKLGIEKLKDHIMFLWQTDDIANDHAKFSRRVGMIEGKLSAINYQLKAEKKGNVKYTFFESKPEDHANLTNSSNYKVAKKH